MAKIEAMEEQREGECRNGHPGTHSYRSVRGRWVCRLCKNARSTAWRKDAARLNHPSRERRNHTRLRQVREQRARALALLGGRCVCCGQTRPVFLQFDHIHNDGNEHRRRIGYSSGQATWRWVLANRETARLTVQVLCANCNMAKAIEENHRCPPTT